MKYIIISLIAFLWVVTMVTPSFSEAWNSAFWKWSSVDANAELSIWWLNWWDLQTDDKALDVIRWAVNWILWLWGLIALIVLLYWWFLMVTSQGEDWYEKWRKVLRAAIIWLWIIWLSWFILSIWFWLAQQTGNSTLGTWACTQC